MAPQGLLADGVTEMLPVLVLNPDADEAFATLAQELVRKGMTIVAFERELRRAYPRAAVHRRGLSGETIDTWYVYRDGRWKPSENLGSRRRTARSVAL